MKRIHSSDVEEEWSLAGQTLLGKIWLKVRWAMGFVSDVTIQPIFDRLFWPHIENIFNKIDLPGNPVHSRKKRKQDS